MHDILPVVIGLICGAALIGGALVVGLVYLFGAA